MRTYGSPSDRDGYRWVAGSSTVSYYNFNTNPSEPNDDPRWPNEQCVEMRGTVDHMWNNIRCDCNQPVICEVPPRST